MTTSTTRRPPHGRSRRAQLPRDERRQRRRPARLRGPDAAGRRPTRASSPRLPRSSTGSSAASSPFTSRTTGGRVTRSTAGPGEVVAIAGRTRAHRPQRVGRGERGVRRACAGRRVRALRARRGAERRRACAGRRARRRDHTSARGDPMSAPLTDEPRSSAAGRWAVLLRTRKRAGSWVGTPVNLTVDGERAYFGTPADSWKVRRLRNFDRGRAGAQHAARQADGPGPARAGPPAGWRRGTRGGAPARCAGTRSSIASSCRSSSASSGRRTASTS